MTLLVDTHAHLTCGECVDDAEALVVEAQGAGVPTIVNICTDIPSLVAGLALQSRCSGVYTAAAVTPHDVASGVAPAFFDLLSSHARTHDLIAIGETGLDYFYEHGPRAIQQESLRRHLLLALECKLPVIFHCRDAFDDLFTIADEVGSFSAVIHCFTGDGAAAARALDRGWYLSFSGIVTYKKSDALRAVAATVPLDRIVVETDTPFLAPQRRRGQQNRPAYVVETAECLAHLKGLTLNAFADAIRANSAALFRL